MQDRVTKILLLVVAGLLAANLAQSLRKSAAPQADLFISAAQAQSRGSVRPEMPSLSAPPTVTSVKGFTVQDLQNVVAVGDGKSFVVSNTKGFMVYQVGPTR